MVAVMREPREIEDEECEQVLARVAAVDVARAPGMVCMRVPHELRPGRRRTRVREVNATTSAVVELAGHLAGEGIGKVTLEAASGYWRVWFYRLEAAGLDARLASGREVKDAPGRPGTGSLGAVWLAKLTGRGMLRPGFIPPAEIRQLRDYTRLRPDLTRDRTRHWQRLEKLLEDALIKMSAVASTLTTASARDMIEALLAGERDPKGTRCPGPGPDARQARSPGRGPDRPLRRPSRRAGPDAARPDRLPHRSGRQPHRPQRGTDRGDARRPRRRCRPNYRPGRRPGGLMRLCCPPLRARTISPGSACRTLR
jgi:Transposase